MLICLSKCVEYITFLLQFLDFMALGIYNYIYHKMKGRFEMYYIDKIKKHLKNWLEYAKEHLIRIVFIALLFVLFCYILTLLPKIMENGEQHILIFGITLSNWSIWIGIFGIICAAIWALYEFDKSRISNKQEKAADIAKIFSDGLLTKCGIVIAVYQNSSINPLLKQIDKLNSPFEHFTTDELREITEADDFPNLYKKERDEFDFDEIYYKILEQKITTKSEYLAKYRKEKDNKNIPKELKKFTTEEARQLFILDNSNLPFHFFNLVDGVLNSLEHVCMNISSHAAGSMFIYQSLHQMFFDTINTLAFEISIRNNGKYSDKFYTNIIYVYNEWQKIYKKSRKNEALRKNQNKKILNPKIKTVE